MNSKVSNKNLKVKTINPKITHVYKILHHPYKGNVCLEQYMYYFSQNPAIVRLYFKALFRAVAIQGWIDFKSSNYRNQHAHSFNNSPFISIMMCMSTHTHAHM